MFTSRPTTKPKLLWLILVVLLLVGCVEIPLVSFVLITGSQRYAVAAYWLGVSLWAIGFVLTVIYAIRFVSGKYKGLKLVPLKKQRW